MSNPNESTQAEPQKRWLKHTWPVEFIGLMAASLILHFLVLRYVYPKSYDLLWPHHSDFYMGPSYANSDNPIWVHLSGPRPIFFLYLEVTGFLGIRGAIAANLTVMLIDGVLIAMIVRRISNVSFDWRFAWCFVLFQFFLWAHPQQYVWSTYDAGAQLSLLFLLLSAVAVRQGQNLWSPAILWLSAFLSKETYALSALVAMGAAAAVMRSRRYVQLFAVLIATGMVALAVNVLNRSVYLNLSGDNTSPYAVVFSYRSLMNELVKYALEGVVPSVWFCMLVVAIVLYVRREVRPLVAVLAAATVLSWVPNALIPLHHAAGYALAGAFPLFAMLLLLCAVRNHWFRNGAMAGVSIFALTVPIVSQSLYRNNVWILEQEERQRNLLTSLTILINGLSPKTSGRSVLISGLNFPFSPFDHSFSLFSIGSVRDTHFTIVEYRGDDGSIQSCESLSVLTTLGIDPGRSLVRFIAPAVARCSKFDEIWMFRSNGTLVEAIPTTSRLEIQGARFDFKELMTAPDVFDVIADHSKNGDMKLLSCGAAFLSYNQPLLALRCLRPAIEGIPDNPYTYFYYGLALEQTGDLELAAKNFRAAINHDREVPPNQAFASALSRVTPGR